MTISSNVFARSSAVGLGEHPTSVDVLHSAFYGNDALTVTSMISRQVALTPSAPAIVCGDRTLTYIELEIASDNLAQRLQRRQLAPNTRIAVLLDRSVDLLVTLLAILKSGSSYIPLDPSYPTARLNHILQNAHPATIVTTTSLSHSVSMGDLEPLILDAPNSPASELGWPASIDDATPDGEAYVIYTSGSTGLPKGVRISHRAMRNFLCSMRHTPGLLPTDVVLAVTTISFDIAVLELFLPLVVGAKIILAREQEVVDGVALTKLMQQHGVTLLQATPMTWRMLLDAGWHNQKLKMLCGGEALPAKLADALLQHGGELWNMYGPTETTVWSSVLRITSSKEPILLGPPIDNTYFRVLDDNLNEVAIGETGELFIGGEGVAMGYVDRPELDAARFIPDPFIEPSRVHDDSTRISARLYRTGDLVCQHLHHSEVCLEFQGRRDHQIKLRGYRIELGEIESTLMRHANIKQAVAIVGGPEDSREIWSYVVTETSSINTTELIASLRASCNQSLPHYMQPAEIVVLEQLPTTPNGKVDRGALPAPERSASPTMPAPQEAATTSENTEQQLAAIWRHILRTEVNPAANFFALGGSSIMAAQLLLAIEQTFGLKLSIGALFETPTLAAQADLIRCWDGREYDFRRVVQLHRSGNHPPLFAIHNTGVYFYRLAMLLGTEQPLTGLQLFEPSARTAYPQTIEEIASEYIDLMRGLQPEGPYRLIGWCVGGVMAYEIARQLTQAKHEVSFLGLIDSWAPGHMRRLSPTRAWLSEHSYRAQLICKDLRKTLAGEKTWLDFVQDRAIIKRWLKLDQDSRGHTLTQLFDERHLSNDHYNRWLDSYLDEVSSRYSPKTYRGKVTLLRSSLEPRGWFIDPLMGWRAFAVGGIEKTVIEGDHFTVFRGVGLQQLAQILSRALA